MVIRYLDAPKKSKITYYDTPPTQEKAPDRASLKDFGFAGGVSFGAKPGSEDVLPMVGQTVGSMIPGVNAFGGSVAGATLGQAARQGVKALRGEKASLGEIPMEAAKTATVEGLFRGAGKLAEPIAGRLMNSILRPATKQMMKGKNLGLEAAKAGFFGTKKSMLGKAAGMVDAGEAELQSLIKTTPGSVDVTKALSGLDEIEQRSLSIGDQSGVNAVQNLKKAIGSGRLNLENANKLKRNLYDALRESQFGTSEVPALATARKTAARGLKEGIEDVLPQAKQINQKIGLGGRVRDALGKQDALEQRQVVIPFFEGAGAFGSILAGHPEYAALIAARRVANTPLVKSSVARALLNKNLGRGLTLTTSEAMRRTNPISDREQSL